MGNKLRVAADVMELLSYKECYEQIDRPLLISHLSYILDYSQFYIDKYALLGIRADFAKNVANFEALPFTTKSDILNEQAEYPPFGRLATLADGHDHRRVHITSGSSGRPVYIVMTSNDASDTLAAGIRAFRCAGLTADDIVVHCLNYCMWAGGVTDHLSLEGAGATVIPFGVGHTHKLIEMMQYVRPTALSCTPSYLAKLEMVLKDDFGLAPPDLGLKKVFCGGEGGLQNPELRKQIEDKWNIRAIDANYGMSDVLSIFAAECDSRQGLHFHGQGIIYLEMIDPVSGKNVPVQDDQVGEMVLTSLKREAQPLIRYRTGDLIRVVSTDRCTCGRGSLRFLVVGRVDEMITVRGINVYPSAIGNLLAKRPDVFSGEFELVLETPPPHEQPLLCVELSASVDPGMFSRVNDGLIMQCRTDLNFTPKIKLLKYGEFQRTEGKTKRVKKLYS